MNQAAGAAAGAAGTVGNAANQAATEVTGGDETGGAATGGAETGGEETGGGIGDAVSGAAGAAAGAVAGAAGAAVEAVTGQDETGGATGGAATGGATGGVSQNQEVTINLSNEGNSAWIVTTVDGGNNVAEVDTQNPTLNLITGHRYIFVTPSGEANPIDFRASDGSFLLAQGQPQGNFRRQQRRGIYGRGRQCGLYPHA